MGILNFLTELFEVIFKGSSPEVKKKQALNKIESELRNMQPCIYKAGMLQANFAELFRVLYENSKSLEDLLAETISSDDIKKHTYYENQLLLTGFTGADQEKLEKLGAEQRKQDVINSNLPMAKVFENQKHTLEYLIKQLNTPEFIKIDEVIANLQQLTDICRFNYLSVIHFFDPDYNGFNPGYEPSFAPCVADSMAGAFQDLYYLVSKFKVEPALSRALIALVQLHKGSSYSTNDGQHYLTYLKKIRTVLTKYLTPDLLLKLIRLTKQNPDFIPQSASYSANSRQKFANYMQEHFESDSNRIKTEIKDNNIIIEIKKLFGERNLIELEGYNVETDKKIQINTSFSFSWVRPLQIIKNFLEMYLNDQVKTLLNDIVIEGFFNNSIDKSNFSTTVFACNEAAQEITNFEAAFGRGQKYDIALVDSYIQDGRKSGDFIKKLESLVDSINEEAHNLVQSLTTGIYDLYKQVSELLVDSKKTKPDIVSNIKVLLTSTRNRENTTQLEQNFESWVLFLEIMKNYAIIGEIEKK